MSKLKLRPVNRAKRGNRFCGPSAISAVTGITTDEAAQLIRSVSGRRMVTGTGDFEIQQALARCGISMRMVQHASVARGPTLAAWLKDSRALRTADRVFLVVAGNHWQVVSGRRYVCGITKDVVGFDHPKVKRRAKVTTVYELTAPKGVTLPTKLMAKPGPTQEQLEDRSLRRKAMALAERHGVHVSVDNERRTDLYPLIWVYGPDYFDEHEGDDPYDGDHMAYSWAEVYERVQTYVEAMANISPKEKADA